MKKGKLLLLYKSITAMFIIAMFLSGCGKDGIKQTAHPEVENNGLPDKSEAYISYYVANNKTVANAYYTTATDIGKFVVGYKSDTTFFSLDFSNTPLTSDITRINQFLFCDSSYDVNGTDGFTFFCQWTGDSLHKLTAGKVYNLNEIRDNYPVPVAASNGVITYHHLHRNLTLITSLSTESNVVEPEASNSYLQISKIADGTASGTFSLAFGCTSSMFGNTVNYIKGVFNKIPVEE